MKRGRLVRLDYRAHNPGVAGSNPAPASIISTAILSPKPAQASKWPSFFSPLLASFEKIRLFSEGLRHAVSDGESIYVNRFSCATLDVTVKQC